MDNEIQKKMLPLYQALRFISFNFKQAKDGSRIRQCLHIKLTGELSFADQEAAENFPTEVGKIIEAWGYIPDQVSNVETEI